MFGPLFYTTAAIATVLLGIRGIGLLREVWRERNEIQGWIAGLKAPNENTRTLSASHLLAKSPEVAMSNLVEATRDPRGEVRTSAYRALINEWTDAPAIEALWDAAKDGRTEMRRVAAQALGNVPLFESLWKVRARSDSEGWRRRSLAVLRRLLKGDGASTVREAAAVSLAKFGRESATIDTLAAATNDPDPAVRLASAQALFNLNGPDDQLAVKTLVDLVADPEPIPDRVAIMEVLQGTDSAARERAIVALIGRLAGDDPALDQDVIACLSMGGTQAHVAVAVLEKLVANDDPGTRLAAGMAIVSILGQDHEKSIAALLDIIVDPPIDQESRNNAIGMVRWSKPKALTNVTPTLILQLGAKSETVRMDACALLSDILQSVPAVMPKTTGPK